MRNFIIILFTLLLFPSVSFAIECNGETFSKATDCNSCIEGGWGATGGQWYVESLDCSGAFTSYDGSVPGVPTIINLWMIYGGGPSVCLWDTYDQRNQKWVLDEADYTLGQCGTPAEDPSCSNEIADNGETGINCGGPCSAVCVETCPDGSVYDDLNADGIDGKCITEVPPDNYGNCPNLTDWYFYPAGGGYPAMCSRVTDPYQAAYIPTEEQLPGVSDPWESTTTENSTSTASTVDNGDGTSTTTTTTNVTNNAGDTSTSTQTDITNNTTGSTISSSTSVTNTVTDPNAKWGDDAKKIVEAVNGLPGELTEDLTGTEASILAAVGTGIDSGLSDQEVLISDEMTAIGTEYGNSPSTWISSETITDKVAFLPAPNTSCQDVGYTMSNGYQVTIPCSAMERIKELLSILFSILTLVYIYDLVFRQDIVKG